MQHLFLTPALLRTQQTVWLCSCYCMRFAGRSLISCAPQMVFSSIVLRRGALGLYRWPLHSAMASLAYRHASTSAVVLSESRRLRQAGLHARRQSAATAAAGAASAASPPAEEAPYPTYVPRNPGITDGAWNQRDAESVALAEQNAEAVAVASRRGDQNLVILGRTLEDLQQLVVSFKQPKFRAKQMYDAMLKGARSIDDIGTIPRGFREELKAQGYRSGRSIVQTSVKAADGTEKFLLQLADGRVVETVGIPVDDQDSPRLTVCVSSQVGCPMRCTFCATGKGGFARNLAVHEIVDQVLCVQEAFGQRVSNVVFMGMGEPLLNLPNVLRAFEVLNQDMGIGARGITISTVGVPNSIKRLAAANIKATLAVSIHAPNQALRESLIPSAKAYPLHALMQDCAAYFAATGRRISYEYTLLRDVNEEVKHAQQLGRLLKAYDMASHVNVIPWNPVDESEFQRPAKARVMAFKAALEEEGVAVSVRSTRGLEAAAACGQLRNRHQKEPMKEFQLPA